MKKLLCLVFAAMMLFSCVVALAEEDLPEINFRGCDFGATLAEVQVFFGEAGERVYSQSAESTNRESYTISELTNGSASGNPDAEINDDIRRVCLSAYGNGKLNVAGYEVASYGMRFVRPVKNGVVVDEDEESILYAAYYMFYSSARNLYEETEIDAVYLDLENKLANLYGEGQREDGENWPKTVWYGKNNTEVILSYGNYPNIVNVVYVWLDAEQLLEEASNALPAPTATPDISNDTSGL